MSLEVKNIIDGLIDISSRIGEASIALESEASIDLRPGLRDRMADAAATYVATVYAAEAAASVSGLSARKETESKLSEARRALGELQSSLRLLRGGSTWASAEVERMLNLTSEALALLIAAGVALRRSSVHSNVRVFR